MNKYSLCKLVVGVWEEVEIISAKSRRSLIQTLTNNKLNTKKTTQSKPIFIGEGKVSAGTWKLSIIKN